MAKAPENKRPPFGIFWDNSNIAFTRRELVPKFEPHQDQSKLRIHFLNLFDYARFRRPVDTFVMVGSIPPENDALWNRVQELKAFVSNKFELIKLSRDAQNREQGVDDTLRAELLRFCVAGVKQPGTVALLTGDGAGYTKGKGFFDAIELVAEQLNWRVQLYAWDCSCHKDMRSWAENHRRVQYKNLEDAYYQLTFIEWGRQASPLPAELQSIDPHMV